jgi:hypothetical protein
MKRTFIGLLSGFWLALPLMGQNPVIPFRSPRATFQTATGQPLSGGCIFTYQGGTTTPQATYTSSTGATPNSNPVILDSTGSGVMWFGVNTYKLVAYSAGGTNCASGSLQWTVDNVPGDAFLNGTISGATITNPAISGGTATGQTVSSDVITGSTINSTQIGNSIPSSGSFTFTAGALNAMSFSASPLFASTLYSYFVMTLTANVTSSSITGGQAGQAITLKMCENSSGGYTFAWPSGLLNPPTFNTAPNACTIDFAYYDTTVSAWVTVATYTGFAPPILPHSIVFADLSNTVYGASALVNLFNSPVAGTIPAAGTATYNGVVATSKCTLTTAATASTTFTLKDGATSVGTIAFAASGTIGAINISAAYPIVSGDQITIVAPASADATAAGLNCSLAFGY